ncbi:hypothetical protein [Rufibacter quisquiliarum]|uniref:Tetratricopeptide repeat protein n=1 Tax=Rufibacter quisquiliarum TaxID=1549639 RepID=A0A839GUX2_9BACT|nr:hypothetical protein [Rufibacter quisquiliarum]MBA9078677.1 hypothetical protein [Rufibacter quisquiliarum]
MNKAAFLNIVRQVAPIQDQEVEDLEKLVVSFPYCQTAHVLLAKAAYDRGSMLSTQKLRRAAAHVSNRQLLKRLVYSQPHVQEVLVPPPAPDETAVPVLELVSEKQAENSFVQADVEDVVLVAAETEEQADAYLQDPIPTAPFTEEELHSEEKLAIGYDPSLAPEAAILEALASLDEEDLQEVLPEALEEPQEAAPERAEVAEAAPEVTLVEDTFPQHPESPDLPEEDVLEAVPEGTSKVVSEEPETTVASEAENISQDTSQEDETELFDLIQINSLFTYTAPKPPIAFTHEEIVSEIVSTSLKAENNALPPAAVEVDSEPEAAFTENSTENTAALEVSLAPNAFVTEQQPTEQQAYQYPTVAFSANGQVAVAGTAAADSYLNIFYQNSLAYWMDSSRLGESLQLKDELTSAKPYYFQPDLILEHVRQNATEKRVPAAEAPAAKLDQQLDIINQFLKSNSRLKTLASVQQKNEPQEDLSAKSSKIKKNLASENLAQIYIKQGKGRKAVKIYEQLIVKFPEKKSYFAQQIEKLRNEP